MMESLVEDCASEEDVKIFEQTYTKQCSVGKPSAKATFDYAWCLSRTKNPRRLQKSISMLQELYHSTTDETAKRDYLFYMALSHTRLKEYDRALQLTEGILCVEPGNHQAADLKHYIEKKMKKDGVLGMAIVGGAAAVGVGALVGLGMALASAAKK